MNEFTASNGVTVSVDQGVQFGPDRGWWGFYGILGQEWDALREFFRAERDEELGRWRWPENPDYVVYPSDQFAAGVAGAWVRVVHEGTSFVEEFARHAAAQATRADMLFPAAAKAYFDAHPERKPWHEAKEGEVWLLTLPNSTQAWFVNGAYFQSTKTLTNIALDYERITDGRRIWSEEA